MYHRFVRISLKELLLALAFVAVACAALKTAGPLWWMVISATALILFMTCAVVSAVERGSRQAFAMGFVICSGIYYALYAFSPHIGNRGMNREMDPGTAIMPSSQLLGWIYPSMVKTVWIDQITGKPVSDDSSESSAGSGVIVETDIDERTGSPVITYNMPPQMLSKMRGMGGGGMALRPISIQKPEVHNYMAVGHMLWTLSIGYVGGRFSQIIYLGRAQRDRQQAGSVSAQHTM